MADNPSRSKKRRCGQVTTVKKPLYADKGEGCGPVRTRLWSALSSSAFRCASAPQSKYRRIRIASNHLEHPVGDHLPSDFGMRSRLPLATVTLFNSITPCVSSRDGSALELTDVPTSSISLKISEAMVAFSLRAQPQGVAHRLPSAMIGILPNNHHSGSAGINPRSAENQACRGGKSPLPGRRSIRCCCSFLPASGSACLSESGATLQVFHATRSSTTDLYGL